MQPGNVVSLWRIADMTISFTANGTQRRHCEITAYADELRSSTPEKERQNGLGTFGLEGLMDKADCVVIGAGVIGLAVARPAAGRLP
jgi:anti-sigma regulatory factor (Ser/Thr protein kinase)